MEPNVLSKIKSVELSCDFWYSYHLHNLLPQIVGPLIISQEKHRSNDIHFCTNDVHYSSVSSELAMKRVTSKVLVQVAAKVMLATHNFIASLVHSI